MTTPSLLGRVIAGGDTRRTRLHDGKGNFVGWPLALRHGPRALVSGLLRLGLGHRPEAPWIAMSATALFARTLGPASRVLEFGSGMSTVWFAQHAGEVCSVESFRPWFDKVSAILAARRLGNVRYQFAGGVEEYSGCCAGDRQGFDLVLVDGEWRSRCVERAAGLLRPGGMLYLDNCDNVATPDAADVRRAEQLALDLAAARGGTVRYFTDFAPTQLFVNQGLLVTLPR